MRMREPGPFQWQLEGPGSEHRDGSKANARQEANAPARSDAWVSILSLCRAERG